MITDTIGLITTIAGEAPYGRDGVRDEVRQRDGDTADDRECQEGVHLLASGGLGRRGLRCATGSQGTGGGGSLAAGGRDVAGCAQGGGEASHAADANTGRYVAMKVRTFATVLRRGSLPARSCGTNVVSFTASRPNRLSLI